jgi:hypothetical protein
MLTMSAAAVALAMPTPEHRAVALPLLAAVVIALSFALVIEAWERSASLDEIGIWYVAALAAYTSLPLLSYLALGMQYTPLNDNRLFTIQPTPADVAVVGWLHVTYMAAFALPYLALRGRHSWSTTERCPVRASAVMVIVGLWVVTNLALVLPALFFDLSAGSYLDQYAVIAQLPLGVRQFLKLLDGTRSVLTILLLIVLFRHYERTRWLIAGVLLWQVATTVLAGGSRTEMMITVVATAILFHRFVARIRLRTAVVGGLIGLVTFLGLGLLRTFRGAADAGPFSVVAGAGEFESLFGNAIDLRDRLDRNEFARGEPAVTLSDLVGPVPSQLLPFAKDDPSSWYLRTFYPELMERGGGLAFGVISQAIAGLGFADLLLRGLLVAFIFAALHRYYRANAGRLWVIAFNAWMIVWAYQSFRASTFAMLTMFVQVFLPTFLMIEIGRRILAGATGRFETARARALPPGAVAAGETAR